MAMLLLQASDLASTVYALQSPEVRELNPLLAGGFPAMLAAKLFCALLFAVLLFRSKRLRVPYLVCVFYMLVVVKNLILR